MKLIKKPWIDLVLEAYKEAARQEVEQKDRFADKFKRHSCLKEFEPANFETLNPETLNPETLNPKMRFSTPSSTLSGNICKAEEPGLAFLQTAKKGLSSFNLQLTENRLQVATCRATEYCFCPLAPEVGN
jgi:hypothetical protein